MKRIVNICLWVVLFVLTIGQAQAQSFEEQLATLDGVSGIEKLKSDVYAEKYLVRINQQIDPKHPDVGTFTQRVIVAHAQKMYHRRVSFKGEKAAKGSAYMVLPNESTSLGDVRYKYKLSYQPWMKKTSFVLVGLLKNERGNILRRYVNVLTDNLYIAEEK